MFSSQPAGNIRIERTIYDPVTTQFILSKDRPLLNVKDWIDRNDCTAYWYILCVHNDSDTTIDEWGIILEGSSGISILNVGIEGVDYPLPVLQSQSKPWRIRWTLGLPHELGIVIPRRGSRRIYFKLGSNACGVEYAINGNFTTTNKKIALREKKYVHSCDVPTLKTAMVKNPDQALQYTRHILTQSYDRETALKLLNSFRLLLDINRCCNTDRYEEMLDKLQLLRNSLENINVKRELLEGIKNTINAIQILGAGEASSYRGVRLCTTLVDEWIQDILHGSGSFPPIYEEIRDSHESLEVKNNTGLPASPTRIDSPHLVKLDAISPEISQEVVFFGGFFRRLIACVADLIIIFILWMILGIIIMVAIQGVLGSAAWTSSENNSTIGVILMISGYLSYISYFTLMDSSPRMRTLGKKMMDLVTVDINYEPLTRRRALERSIIKSFLLVFSVFIPFSKKKQAIHDMLVGSYVITLESYEHIKNS